MGAVVEAATEFEFQILGRPRVTCRGKTTPDMTRAELEYAKTKF